jgi:predicted transcriptional regulator
MSDFSNVEHFVSIYNEIDDILRRMLHEESWVSYHELVERTARFNRIVREYKEDLKLIGNLRNVIVHRSTNQIIAEPAPFIVELASKIKSMLLAPPNVIPKFRKDVCTAGYRDSVGHVAKLMADNNFSRIPIFQEGQFIFLATAEAIVRFISRNIGANLSDVSVSEVYPFMEHKDNVQFISKDTNIFKAAEIFEIYHKNGKKMDAIIITDSGSKTEKPIGIITPFDVGEIYRQMEIRVNSGLH